MNLIRALDQLTRLVYRQDNIPLRDHNRLMKIYTNNNLDGYDFDPEIAKSVVKVMARQFEITFIRLISNSTDKVFIETLARDLIMSAGSKRLLRALGFWDDQYCKEKSRKDALHARRLSEWFIRAYAFLLNIQKLDRADFRQAMKKLDAADTPEKLRALVNEITNLGTVFQPPRNSRL